MVSQERSKKSIDRAGTALRDWWRGDDPLDSNLEDAIAVVVGYREGFNAPLNTVTMGIRSRVKTIGAPVVVSQRLKRLPTIVDKLDRHQNMKLSRMQDIGGCRAILPDDAAVRNVVKRIERGKRWDVREFYDYVTTPKSTGYRAVHVVVCLNDRLIEIQLRTERQHGWASVVERFSGRPSFGRLKDGDAPEIAVAYFEAASRVMALQETGAGVDDTLANEFNELREAFRNLDSGDKL